MKAIVMQLAAAGRSVHDAQGYTTMRSRRWAAPSSVFRPARLPDVNDAKGGQDQEQPRHIYLHGSEAAARRFVHANQQHHPGCMRQIRW
ncbi:hypothetical protein PsYK624_121420 [Phanerochaete sordida]|uniref:Uncharacterized protein n=1 Tax=Phanerochaete sordida TaxID=48140 RepID=A0A9P3LI32_9APHY|nr:hypothetical protein PsYK624_121420 [Phanerochaete sordida]